MNQGTEKTIELTFKRSIPASPAEVFDAWLSPTVPGTPWSFAEKVILNAQADGLFYANMAGVPHFGRFIDLQPAARIQHSWVSPATSGKESIVTVSFSPEGDGTLMTLIHTHLPDTDKGRSHQQGWTFFLDKFHSGFAGKPA